MNQHWGSVYGKAGENCLGDCWCSKNSSRKNNYNWRWPRKRSGRKLGRVFIENGFVTEEAISGALARQLNIPYVNLKQYNLKPQTVQMLPEMQARRFRAIPLEDRGNTVLVGMADPTDLFAYDEVKRVLEARYAPGRRQ